MRRRRQLWRATWVRSLLRALSILVVGLFLAQSTLAYVFIVADACADSCPEDEERSCECPLDCSKGCCAARVPAVAATPLLTDLLSPWSPGFLVLLVERAPPSVDPGEVLHVPRRAVCDA